MKAVSSEFSDLLEIRNLEIDGLSEWLWIKEDTGAWEGPVKNWVETHKQAYFEHIKKFDVCVQAGGNCGLYPRLLSEHFKRVYTFEPDYLNFHCLVNNCQKQNIFKMQAALGSSFKLVDLDIYSMKNVGLHQVIKNKSGFIPMVTLDSFSLDACDFIQLDVEEYEYDVLKGAENTIRKYKPVISVERTNWSIEGFLYRFGYIRGKTVELDTIYY